MKQPNDAWSGSSTTWPEANLALDRREIVVTGARTSPAEHRWVELATGRPAFRVAYSFGGVLTARPWSRHCTRTVKARVW
jgi:hypothetical protein